MNLFDLGALSGTGARLVAQVFVRSPDKVEQHCAELAIVVGDPRDTGAVTHFLLEEVERAKHRGAIAGVCQ